MSEPGLPKTSSDLWHCPRCGTPNSSRPYHTRCLGCGGLRPSTPAPVTREAAPSSGPGRGAGTILEVPEGSASALLEGPPPESRLEAGLEAEPWPDPPSGPALGPEALPSAETPRRIVGPPTPSPGRARPGRRLLPILTWAYACLVLAVLAMIHWVGEAWWGVTVLLFIPRWLFLGPVALLALASACVRKPSDWALQGAIALVVSGPLMALSLPLHQLWTREVEGDRFRILTYNLSMDPVDARHLIRMIESERVDFICFQEGFIRDPMLEEFLSRGWYCDERRYIASRHRIVEELPPLPNHSASEDRSSARLTRVRIRTERGIELILASVHMPTIRRGFNRLFGRDTRGMASHVEWWASELDRVVRGLSEARDVPFLVGGDFNMPSDDSSMATLKTALRFGFEDAGWGYGYTRPSRYPWFRIDHIMASPEWTFTRCWVGPDCGSDHLPLLAEVALPGPPGRAASRTP